MKDTTSLRIDQEVFKNFKKKCIDNNTNYSDAMEELMKEYNKRK